MQTFLILLILLIAGADSRREGVGDHAPVASEVFSERACAAYLIEKNRNGAHLPRIEVLERALTAMEEMRAHGCAPEREVLTVVDFSLPSVEKRMWIFDLADGALLHHTYSAHGQKSGDDYAESFSNAPESHQSSLGLYLTGTTYHGKHGRSLYLNGLWEGLNHNAMRRYVVLHGADYVSEDFIRTHGRLGRSFGCPAVPADESDTVIDLIEGGTCLFIYHPELDNAEPRLSLSELY